MQIRKRQLEFAFAALLIVVSILAQQPRMILAAPNQQGTVSINATGQAFPIGNGNGKGKGNNKGSQSSATLTLTGNAGMDGNELKLSGLSGMLQIDSTNYPLSGGDGEGNKHGNLEIQTQSNGGDGMELVLHGSMDGNNVFFTNPQSKLASLFFLSLSGQITINVNSGTNNSNSSTTSESGDQPVTVTQTSTETVTQNNTITQNGTTTVTELQNQTFTVTQPVNITLTETITQPENVTITVTQTGTNSTITQTITTVSNSTTTETVTITQNVTVTVT